MDWIRLLLASVGVTMILGTLAEYRRKRFRKDILLLWMGLWSFLAIAAVYPPIMIITVEFLKLGLPVHVITVLSIIILFLLVYRMYIRLMDLDDKLTELTQENALKRLQRKAKNDKEKRSKQT